MTPQEARSVAAVLADAERQLQEQLRRFPERDEVVAERRRLLAGPDTMPGTAPAGRCLQVAQDLLEATTDLAAAARLAGISVSRIQHALRHPVAASQDTYEALQRGLRRANAAMVVDLRDGAPSAAEAMA